MYSICLEACLDYLLKCNIYVHEIRQIHFMNKDFCHIDKKRENDSEYNEKSWNLKAFLFIIAHFMGGHSNCQFKWGISNGILSLENVYWDYFLRPMYNKKLGTRQTEKLLHSQVAR